MDKYVPMLSTFPTAPRLIPGHVPLSLSSPPPAYLEASATQDPATSYLIQSGTVCRLLIPISQLESHPAQRDLDIAHARCIYDSFDGNPGTFMLNHPGVAVLKNPDQFPSEMPERDRLHRVDNPVLRFQLLSGQHRRHALILYCEQHGIPESFGSVHNHREGIA